MKRRILIAIGLTLAVVTGMAASSGDFSPGGWARSRLVNTPLGRLVSGTIGRLLVLRSEMNVSGEQRAKIRQLLMTHRAQIVETVKALRDRRVALRDAVLSGKAGEAQIRAAAAELGKVIGDAAVRASKLRDGIAPILTEEQRELVREFFMENDRAIDRFLTKAASGQ